MAAPSLAARWTPAEPDRPAPALLVPVRAGRPSPAVYRRRRTVAAGLVAAAGLAAWAGVHALVAGPGDRLGPTEDVVAHVVVVRPGDTLWSIALASGARGDLRPLVDELSAEVHGQPLQVGERITVP